MISAKDSGEVKLGDKATFTVEAFPNRHVLWHGDANSAIAADK